MTGPATVETHPRSLQAAPAAREAVPVLGAGPPLTSLDVPLEPTGVPVVSAPTPNNSQRNGVKLMQEDGRHLAAQQLAPAAAPPRRQQSQAPLILVARPLPRVLLLHCGGTMGMDARESFEQDPEVGLVRPLLVCSTASILLGTLVLCCCPSQDQTHALSR